MNELGMFAKYWEPGQVKTRLAESIGATNSSLVYKYFIECLLARFGRSADRCLLAIWPGERQSDFAQLDDSVGWQVETQSGGGLGVRMAAYFERALTRSPKVVLIGSDSPNVPSSFIYEAFEELQSKQVVIGPSEDGGYYLIGMRANMDIFSGVQWSTPAVLHQTVEILNRLEAKYSVLHEWYDVDHESDLARLRGEIENHADQDLAILGRKLNQLLS